MGRGRAKAKQTKVARDLKYNSPNMDLDRLRADLGTGESHEHNTEDAFEDDGDLADEDDEWSASH
ncbi:MAG: DUF3073 domain-containing protein [Frankia sp.]